MKEKLPIGTHVLLYRLKAFRRVTHNPPFVLAKIVGGEEDGYYGMYIPSEPNNRGSTWKVPRDNIHSAFSDIQLGEKD